MFQSRMAMEVYQRLNYLYQVIVKLSESPDENMTMIRHHCKVFSQIAQKKVLRVDPQIRRRICRKCFIFLLPGVTCSSRYTI